MSVLKIKGPRTGFSITMYHSIWGYSHLFATFNTGTDLFHNTTQYINLFTKVAGDTIFKRN